MGLDWRPGFRFSRELLHLRECVSSFLCIKPQMEASHPLWPPLGRGVPGTRVCTPFRDEMHVEGGGPLPKAAAGFAGVADAPLGKVFTSQAPRGGRSCCQAVAGGSVLRKARPLFPVPSSTHTRWSF